MEILLLNSLSEAVFSLASTFEMKLLGGGGDNDKEKGNDKHQ